MPLDHTGAPAPSSPHAERLARLKIIRRKARAEATQHRRFSKARLERAEAFLAEVIDGADFVADVILNDVMWPKHGVVLVVTLPAYFFKQLCEFGAELEDLEENGDEEPDALDEPSLGSADGQPDQTDWAKGAGDDDREDDEEREGDDWALPAPDGETPHTGAA